MWLQCLDLFRDTYRASCNGPLASGAENLRYAGDGWSGSETRVGGEQWAVQCLGESEIVNCSLETHSATGPFGDPSDHLGDSW